MRNTIVASVLGLALIAAGIVGFGSAYAGDEAPAPAAKTATATPSPIHTMMKWVSSHVLAGDGCGCPSTAEGEKAWRAWYKAENPKLATLRGALVADGWNADTTISFFKTMAAKTKADGGCAKGSGCCKSQGAAAATGDAGKTGDAASKSGCCGKCGDGAGCKKAGCKKAGCDKAGCKKAGGCCKEKGAAAATGDAGKTGDAAPTKCPCTGKPIKDCSGCGKDSCPCGEEK